MKVLTADWTGAACASTKVEYVPLDAPGADGTATEGGSGSLPWIIAGVVVVLGGVGGFCIYKKKKDAKDKETKEGGSKALFKTQIKKNAAHKEALV